MGLDILLIVLEMLEDYLCYVICLFGRLCVEYDVRFVV